MRLEIIATGDGSPTIFAPDLDEHYHSIHGAFNESMHVFINAGLLQKTTELSDINLLEIGLGTGSNVLLTNATVKNLNVHINYHALEPYPINKQILSGLISFGIDKYNTTPEQFLALHQQPAETPMSCSPQLTFTAFHNTLENMDFTNKYDLIYFDAFGPRVQPEIWSAANFKKLLEAMNPNGILVTYCAKGEVRRTMQAVGFSVEKLPGPPGKREMLRATKK